MKKIYYKEHNFPRLGELTLVSFEDDLVYIGINKPVNFDNMELIKDITSHKEVISQINEYISGERKSFDLKIRFLTGTVFQRGVWYELQNIPYGSTISYKELAKRVNNPDAARAVGNANSKNPIPIIIPCHRVINSNGKLGGFSCGVNLKRILLDIEGNNKH